MGEVLADPAPRLQGVVDRAVGLGHAGLVVEGFIDRPRQGLDRGQGIEGAQAVQIVFGDKGRQGRGLFDEAMGMQEVETFALDEGAAQPVPLAQVEAVGQGRGGFGLHGGAGFDRQPVMGLGHVEVIDGVAEGVDIGEQLRRRLDLQLEADHALAWALLRLGPQLHDAGADGLGIVVLGQVADFEKHG